MLNCFEEFIGHEKHRVLLFVNREQGFATDPVG